MKKEEQNQNMMLAVALTKAVVGLEGAIQKLKDLRPLETEDYETFALFVEKYVPDPAATKFAELLTLLCFLKALWLSAGLVNWAGSAEVPAMLERVGRAAMKVQAGIVRSLAELSARLAYPKEVKSLEKHLFELYEIFTSPINFADKVVKGNLIASKINKEKTMQLFSPYAGQVARPKHAPRKIEEILQISQHKLGFEPGTGSDVPGELARIMCRLQTFAAKDLQLHVLWLNYFIATLTPATLAEQPAWATDRSKAGWASFNVCILALEQFAPLEGTAALREKLISAFLVWSHKALEALVALAREGDPAKAELLACVYSAYLFPMFIFFGYVSRTDHEVAVAATQLSTETVAELLKVDLKKVLTPANVESVFSSLYFLFSFTCKQVGKHMVSAGETPFALAQNWNFIALGLQLFRYIFACFPSSVGQKKEIKVGLAWDIPVAKAKKRHHADSGAGPSAKKKSGKPSTTKEAKKKEAAPVVALHYTQEALDSLEEIVAMLSCLVGCGKDPVKARVNVWLSETETIALLLGIVGTAPEVGLGEVGGVIGKLVIELTQKDACYNSAVWANIASALAKYLSDPTSSLNGYMLALILKLALCCYNKLEQKAYPEKETELIRKLWVEVVKCLMTKNVDPGRQQYREIAILFLLQTILKPRGEAVLCELFLALLPQLGTAELRSHHYELFLKVYLLVSLETEVMKVCSDLLGSILLKGTEAQIELLDFSKLSIAVAFNKLLTICGPAKEGLTSLENLAPLQGSGLNTALFDQLLASPDLVHFADDSRDQSPNYYLHSLLQLASQSSEAQNVGEQLQVNILGLSQYYTETSFSSPGLNQLVYIQSVLHMYILYADTMLQKGSLSLPSAEDVVYFLGLATDHAIRTLEAELLSYFASVLAQRPESLPLAGVLKDLAMQFLDLKSALGKLGLPDLDLAFLAQLLSPVAMSDLADKLATGFGILVQDKEKRHRAFVSVMEAHFSPHLLLPTEIESVCKAIFSTVQLLGGFLRLSGTIFKLSQCPPQNVIPLTAKIGSVTLASSDRGMLDSKLGELCKAAAPANGGQLQSSVYGLITMKRASQALDQTIRNESLLKSHKDQTQKAVELLLELWSTHANSPSLGVSMEDSVSAKDLAEYDFGTAVKDIAALLKLPVPTSEIPMRVLIAIHECVSKKPENKPVLSVLQEQLLSLENAFFRNLFLLKDPEHSLHSILSNLMVDSEPLKQKLFTILIELITSNPNTEKAFLKEHLKLLSEIISQKREAYMALLLSKLLAWAQTCASDELQSTILNYLTSTCYPDLAVQYPKEQSSVKLAVDLGEEIVDGYGVEQYVRKEEPAKPGACCSFAKTRRKNDTQPWYHCFTCNLTESKGCCAVCAKLCHKGHKVAFAKVSQMFCNCHSECDCMALPRDYDSFESEHSSAYYASSYNRKPGSYRDYEARSPWGDERGAPAPFGKFTDSSMRFRELAQEVKDEESEGSDEPIIEDDDSPPEKLLPLDESSVANTVCALIAAQPQTQVAINAKADQSPEPSIDEKSVSFEAPLPPRDVSYEKPRTNVPTLQFKCKMEDKETRPAQTVLTAMCKQLLGAKSRVPAAALLEEVRNKAKKTERSNDKLLAKSERSLRCVTSIAQSKQVFDIVAPNAGVKKPGQMMYSEPPSTCKSYLSHMPTARGFITTNRAGLIAVAFKDSISAYNAETLANESERSYSSEKAKIPPIAKVQLGFHICSATFNEANEAHLAVAGIRDCVVLTLDPATGQTVSKLAVDLMLQAMGEDFTISKVQWLPKSQVHLAIAANIFIKVYDLSADNISPIYTISSMGSGIKDMTIAQEQFQPSSYRFFALTNEAINTAAVDVPPKFAANGGDSNVQLVEAVAVPETVHAAINQTHTVSVYYSNATQMLFVTLGNGKIIYGELDENKAKFKRTVIVAPAEDASGTHKFFFDLKEVDCSGETLWLAALSSGSQLQAVLLKIEETETSVQLLKPKIEGVLVITGKTGTKKVLVPSDDAYLATFIPQIAESRKQLVRVSAGGVRVKLLEKERLPQSVTMPFDFFEKAMNVTDPSVNLMKKIKLSGTMNLLVGKDNLALFEWLVLGRGGNQFPVGIPPVTLDITIDNNDYVIAGVRIMAETSAKQYVGLFNRRVQLGQNVKSVTDIGLCDAEILAIENNTLSLVLEAEESPIKLKGVEVYVFYKDTFGFNDKMAKLEQAVARKVAVKGTDLSRFSPIMNTKTYQTVPWIEKEDLLLGAIQDPPALRALVSALDFFSSVAYTSEPVPEPEGRELLNMLEDYLYLGVEDGIALRVLRSAARKCAKAVIFNLTHGKERVEGDRLNYYTYKSEALFNYVNSMLKGAATYDMLEKYVKSISRLASKNRLCFFDRIRSNLETIAKISVTLLDCMEKVLEGDTVADNRGRAKEALEHFVNIVIGYNDYLLNMEWRKDPKRSPHSIFEESYTERISILLGPYMLTKNEEIKSLIISVMPEVMRKRDIEYAYTCQTPVTRMYSHDLFLQTKADHAIGASGPVSLEIRAFDFSYMFALTLCSFMIEKRTDEGRRNPLVFVLMYHILHGVQQCISQLRVVEPRTDDDWCAVFAQFVSTAMTRRNVSNPSDRELALLGLKAFNLLFCARDVRPRSAGRSTQSKPLSQEFGGRLLGHLYASTNLLDWAAGSLSALFSSLKEKHGSESLEPMQDSAEKKPFLRIKQKSTKSEPLFGDEIGGRREDTVEGSEAASFQELVKLCYNVAACEQSLTKNGSKPAPAGFPTEKSFLRQTQMLKGVKDILCEALLTPSLAAMLDTSAQLLFKMLSKTKNELNQYKDNYVYNLSFKGLKETAQRTMTSYESQINAYKQLTGIWKVAKERPTHWRIYAKANSEAVRLLFQISATAHDRIAFQALALICLALENEERDSFNIKNSCEMLTRYPAHTLDIIEIIKYTPGQKLISPAAATGAGYSEDIFARGLEAAEKLSLDSVSMHMRVVAAHLFRGLWDSGTEAQRERILEVVVKKITPDFHRYGCATLQLLTLCLCLLQGESEKTEAYAGKILEAVREGVVKAANIVRTHENGEIYKEIQGMVVQPVRTQQERKELPPTEENKEFLYCFEDVPCGVCISDIGQPYTTQKVGDLKEDSKFTDSAYIYRLNNSYSIQKITARVEITETKYVKTFNVYVSNSRETDLAEMRNNWALWRKAGSISLKARSRSILLEFPVPVTTSVIMLEFVVANSNASAADQPQPNSSLYSFNGSRGMDMLIGSGDTMMCPRCMRVVPNMHGICASCGENILQCPHCHNINYDKLDAFICGECGHCRYGKIDIAMSVRTGFATQKIVCEKDKAAMQASLSNTLGLIMRSHETISRHRAKLAAIVRSPAIKSGEKAGRYIDIYDIYMNSCVPEYRKLVKLLRNANSIKSELLQYSSSGQAAVTSEPPKLEPPANCYGCAEVFLQVFLKFAELSACIPICCKYFRKTNAHLLMLESILPSASPGVGKQVVRTLVALAAQDMFFAEVIVRRAGEVAERLRKEAEDPAKRSQLRDALVLNVELLIRLHSRLALTAVQQKLPQEQCEIYAKVNECLWGMFLRSFPLSSALAAEEIVQPILAYVVQFLSLQEVAQVKSAGEAGKTLLGWLSLMKTSTKDVARNVFDSLMEQCLLFSECKSLRETAAKVMRRFFAIMPATMVPTANAMVTVIWKVFGLPQETAEGFMSVLKHLITKLDVAGGDKFDKKRIVKQLLDLSQQELDRLQVAQTRMHLQEDSISRELWTGYSLYSSLDLVIALAQNKEFFPKTSDPALACQIIRCFAKARKLLTISNSYIDKSLTSLETLFNTLPQESLDERKTLMGQCIQVLYENRDDEEIRIALYSELHRLVNPEKPEPKYCVLLQKASTQEMFIRGNMNKSPYQASDLGTTMRDIRAKVCKDLEMKDAEQIMEMLVGGKIIELDLPIRLVYEKVWWPHIYRQKNPDAEEIPPIEHAKPSELDPMCVIYRLAGVDGEATENRIESLAESRGTEDPEIAFAAATVFAVPMGGTASALEMMLDHLKGVVSLQKRRLLVEQIVKLLSVAVKVQAGRKKLIEIKGTNVLATKLIEFLPMYETPEGHIVDSLILILENVITEANKSVSVLSLQNNVVDISHIKKILERLNQTCEKMIVSKESISKPGKYVGPLTRILPYFVYGSVEAVNVLVNYFKQWINFAELDAEKDSNAKQRFQYHTSRLIDIIESIPSQIPLVRDALVSSGVTETIIAYIRARLPADDSVLQKSYNGMQAALKLLIGMCKDHRESQMLLYSNKVIEPIYRLSISKSAPKQLKDVCLLCEIFIEEITKEAIICKEAHAEAQELISRTREEKKKQAERKKAEILKKMNLQKTEGMLKPRVDTSIFGVGEAKMEDEKGLSCVICHEGYNFKPADILGVYVYSKSYEIRGTDNYAEKYSAAHGISTVTHLNMIHLSCHLNAAKADKAMKQPKGEWEGAIIRNSHTKCNNWLPIRGGTVTDDSYNNAVSKYFSNMRNIVKTEQPKARIMANDIKFMLKKFAYEESFSHYSHGGGPLHNIQLIPFMVQIALFLGVSGEGDYTVAGIDSVLTSFFTTAGELDKELRGKQPLKVEPLKESSEEEKPADKASMGAERDLRLSADDFAYVATLMLLSYRYSDWAQAKQKLLSALLSIAANMALVGVTGKKHVKKGVATKIINVSADLKVGADTGLARVMKEIRPMLILLCIIEEFKKQQTTLLKGEPTTREEMVQQLFASLTADHTKVNETTASIHDAYTNKFLEFGAVDEFLAALGAPAETLGQFKELFSLVSM